MYESIISWLFIHLEQRKQHEKSVDYEIRGFLKSSKDVWRGLLATLTERRLQIVGLQTINQSCKGSEKLVWRLKVQLNKESSFLFGVYGDAIFFSYFVWGYKFRLDRFLYGNFYYSFFVVIMLRFKGKKMSLVKTLV